MKIQFYATILIISLVATGLACKKKSNNPIDDLPSATTTGANTFGCLVNGELFIPKVKSGPLGALKANYDVYNSRPFLSISARNNQNPGSSDILLFINASSIKQGENYSLTKRNQDNEKSYGVYNYRGPKESYGTDYNTNDQLTGNIKITYFDKYIVAGTFWFNAVSDAGEKVEIREGRFDIKL
ncbi:DUF6252 family protein [Pedobacter sp. PF22-3]|uniref:DUF6252 family protein n=1 Tax=Pedobacter sp. PF22-3 TaxID=2994467 RepID=UPI0022457975|nr:DUF6252 family protein [Pedobacter sp. PF22-3]MCX2494762.1 DUF6252 family protein [Pedobacter sp. PF22-3]